MGALRRQGGRNLRDEHGVHAPQVTWLEVEGLISRILVFHEAGTAVLAAMAGQAARLNVDAAE